ncbi:hypothetical protein Ciccas_012451 [Cichlidogyrus casuarinus]|uniref:C2H2-type domain-containing protein n=1 Tax=Cichlidogyrus casuarinus TaxID=1844966 RepID=A0ABD2PQ55_9PLAT
MFHCLVCGSRSRLFDHIDDLETHLNTFHRPWLDIRKGKKLQYIGETEEDIAKQTIIAVIFREGDQFIRLCWRAFRLCTYEQIGNYFLLNTVCFNLLGIIIDQLNREAISLIVCNDSAKLASLCFVVSALNYSEPPLSSLTWIIKPASLGRQAT